MTDSTAHNRINQCLHEIGQVKENLTGARQEMTKHKLDTERRLALIMEHLGVEIVNEPEHWVVKKKGKP